MPQRGLKNYPCVSCGKRTKANQRRFIIGPTYAPYRQYLRLHTYQETVVTCTDCYSKFYRSYHNQADNTYIDTNVTDNDSDYEPPNKMFKHVDGSPKIIPLPINSSGKSHSCCSICKKRNSRLITLSTESRHQIFILTGHLLLPGARCCPSHITDSSPTVDAIKCLEASSTPSYPTYFNKSDIISLISTIRKIALNNGKQRLDFDTVRGLTDADYFSLTGISKENFDDVVSHVQSIRSTKTRSIRTYIALLLVKLRTGVSNQMLSTIFNIDKCDVRRALNTARTEFTDKFTPRNIGFGHVTRDEVIEHHTRPLAQEMFGSVTQKPVILVVDRTYVYIQKSSNFKFQRRSYSQHKNRSLVKPMVIVSTTGYIISILGPYFADSKNNDAQILKHSFQTNVEDIKNWLQHNDVLVVDRGFRDSLDFLENLGIKAHMPAFLPKGQKQHTVEEVNSSRLVTKTRWIVESVNGRVKQWKYFQNVVPNTQIPYIRDYICLIAALCNKYRQPLNAGNLENDKILAAKMKFLASQKNMLQTVVESNQLQKRVKAWTPLNGSFSIPDFPQLSDEELWCLIVGVYQLKLAKSYTMEHFCEDGDCQIFINTKMQDILRVKIQSRHISSKQYHLWIQYTSGCITGWYCLCRAGARVVGVCAHVASVLWYLSNGRHSDTIRSVHNWSSFLEDASIVPQLIDGSESEDNSPEE